MVLNHIVGLFSHPREEWEAIREERCSIGKCYASNVLILAAIPPICAYIGSTTSGWMIGAGASIKLEPSNALQLALSFYLLLMLAVFIIGKTIHWMAQTFDTKPELSKCIVLAAYIATPLFVSGLSGLLPIIWLNVLFGLLAFSYTVYLLFVGIPIVLKVPEERSFIFSSSVFSVGLIGLVCVMVFTALMFAY